MSSCVIPKALIKRASSVFQKRASRSRPPWVEVWRVAVPGRGRSAEKVVAARPGNLLDGQPRRLELHPHRLRADDSIIMTSCESISISTGIQWPQVREVAGWCARRSTISGCRWPKTSGSAHDVYVRIERRWWSSTKVRRAAADARARGGAARAQARAEQVVEGKRHGVFTIKPERRTER